MILSAADHAASGRYRSPYRCILVDELQDISASRARLIKALADQAPSHRLFGVGDDWQSINRFAGSDIALMRECETNFGPTETVALDRTFRCTAGINAVATRFVLANPAQIDKYAVGLYRGDPGVRRRRRCARGGDGRTGALSALPERDHAAAQRPPRDLLRLLPLPPLHANGTPVPPVRQRLAGARALWIPAVRPGAPPSAPTGAGHRSRATADLRGRSPKTSRKAPAMAHAATRRARTWTSDSATRVSTRRKIELPKISDAVNRRFSVDGQLRRVRIRQGSERGFASQPSLERRCGAKSGRPDGRRHLPDERSESLGCA